MEKLGALLVAQRRKHVTQHKPNSCVVWCRGCGISMHTDAVLVRASQADCDSVPRVLHCHSIHTHHGDNNGMETKRKNRAEGE